MYSLSASHFMCKQYILAVQVVEATGGEQITCSISHRIFRVLLGLLHEGEGR